MGKRTFLIAISLLGLMGCCSTSKVTVIEAHKIPNPIIQDSVKLEIPFGTVFGYTGTQINNKDTVAKFIVDTVYKKLYYWLKPDTLIFTDTVTNVLPPPPPTVIKTSFMEKLGYMYLGFSIVAVIIILFKLFL